MWGENIVFFFFYIIWINCGKSASHCKRAKESFCNIVVGTTLININQKFMITFPNERIVCILDFET